MHLVRFGTGAVSTAARLPCLRDGVNRSGTSTACMLKLTERSSVALITKPPAVRTLRNLSLRPWPYLTQSESTEMIFTLSSTGGSTPSQKTFVRVCWPTLMQRPFLLIVSLHPAATPYCVEHRRHSSRLCCRADACAAGGVGGTHQQKKFIVITRVCKNVHFVTKSRPSHIWGSEAAISKRYRVSSDQVTC